MGRVIRVVLVAVAALLVTAVTLAASLPYVFDEGDGDSAWPGWGFTHTQFSADDGEPAAVDTIADALKAGPPMLQSQHIMGWGVDNPEPAPGQYNFADLDLRMDFIQRTGGVPVIVLCCSPDWMKGGEEGETDWDNLEVAPLPEHFADFAALSKKVAQRYPYVRHFVVWNEFKGFFDDERKRWRAEDYTDLYNAVYDAVKEANPENQVGGPYLDFASLPPNSPDASEELHGAWGAVDQRVLDAFTYWNQHRKGADFVVVDGHATTTTGASNEFAALEEFGAVGAWLQKQTDLPIWWTEWYVDPASLDFPPEHQVALRVSAMIELASTGAQTVLYWNPYPKGADCAICLWTDTWKPDGGQPLPFLTDVIERFVREFPPDVERRKVPAADGLVALEAGRTLLVVNITDAPISATVHRQQIEMSPYEVKWVTLPRWVEALDWVDDTFG
ncbi:hypothetical protein MGALJ_38030 [Mycobacterium gallinarum]|uniref:Glycosyl hydrolases family 39 N-terminal catalytic domain-containing protein n=1 Tax=Mycobacterium gallinarum TaxID=39689 RepID=A0A9W4FGL3_9MYCO|nr:xylan 1,4-beta-xylosidase [Mycobacterium gallinarum]BBY94134.1 hypothetical protein MGALJ_38030 [Mycobacterium gallinarum]